MIVSITIHTFCPLDERSKQTEWKKWKDRFMWHSPAQLLKSATESYAWFSTCANWNLGNITGNMKPLKCHKPRMVNKQNFMKNACRIKCFSLLNLYFIYFMWLKRHKTELISIWQYSFNVAWLIRTHYHSIINLMFKELIYSKGKLLIIPLEGSMCLNVFHWGSLWY